MKKCKHCQSEIDEKAKICPKCQKKQGMSKGLKIFLIVMIAIILVSMIFGSNKENSSGTNVSNGTNISTGTNKSDSTTGEIYSPSELSKNISSQGAVSTRGKLIVIAKNNNKVPIDMEIEVEFYDENGVIVGSSEESLKAVGPKSEIAIEMWSTPEVFNNYKIYIDVEQSTSTCYLDKVELTHNNTGENIAVQVKNNSEETIEYITVRVVYYQGEQIVGIDDGIESEIKPERSANFTLDFPYNKNYDNIRFDSYKVFITEAYSYNW